MPVLRYTVLWYRVLHAGKIDSSTPGWPQCVSLLPSDPEARLTATVTLLDLALKCSNKHRFATPLFSCNALSAVTINTPR